MTSAIAEKYYRRAEAAQFLRERFAIPSSSQQLAKLAVIGGGPAYHKFSRYPIYREVDLVDWVNAKLGKSRHSTSDTDEEL